MEPQFTLPLKDAFPPEKENGPPKTLPTDADPEVMTMVSARASTADRRQASRSASGRALTNFSILFTLGGGPKPTSG